MARQVKWEDPTLQREKEEREKDRAIESENERREDSRESVREARE
jgi:hypothetical protein